MRTLSAATLHNNLNEHFNSFLMYCVDLLSSIQMGVLSAGDWRVFSLATCSNP